MGTELRKSLKTPFLAKQRKAGSWEWRRGGGNSQHLAILYQEGCSSWHPQIPAPLLYPQNYHGGRQLVLGLKASVPVDPLCNHGDTTFLLSS